MNAAATPIAANYSMKAAQLQQQGGRKVWLTKKNGDVVGSNYTIPKGDFARFLGYKAPSAAEERGEAKVSADRVLEVALQKQFRTLGKQSMQNGERYRNMYISHSAYDNKPGREKDMLNDGLDSIKQSVEMNQGSNMYYLEMQYKFQLASKNFGVISNLMKVRSEATKKAVAEIR